MQWFNKVLVVSTCCLVFILLVGFIGFNGIMQFAIRDQTALKHRNQIYKFYLKLPVPLIFNVYFFNVTNPMEVQEGAKPVLVEIGPYSYDDKMRWYNIVLIGSACSLASLVFMGFVGFNGMMEYAIKDKTCLKPGNEVYDFYRKLPFPLTFNVYFFNVSNPADVMKGAKPVLKEVGPYSYDAYKEKIDIVENSSDDSLTYTPYETYFFNQERSGELKQDDYVTVLHPLIVGMVNYAVQDQPSLLTIVNKALASIFKPDSIYVTARVRDILFEGMLINCSVSDFAGKAVCTQLKLQEGMKEIEKNILMFSLFGPRNGTVNKRITVRRGTRNSNETGMMLRLDGKKELDTWEGEGCNKFRGTDGWIFPPYIDKSVGVWAFAYDLCRSINAYYVEDADFRGISAQLYHAELGNSSCYCTSPETCPPAGLMDLTKCMKVPIIASLPHFLKADPMVLEQVDGMHPELDRHIVRIIMQPMLGLPVDAQRRLQLNLKVQPVPKISFMKTLPEAIHPIFWIEEGVVIDGPLFSTLNSVFVLLKVVAVMKYIFLVGCFAGLGVGGYYRFKSTKSAQITPVHKAKPGSGMSDKVGLGMTETSSDKAWEDGDDRGHVNHGMTVVD